MGIQTTDNLGISRQWLMQALATHLALLSEAVPDGERAQRYLRHVAVSLGLAIEEQVRTGSAVRGPFSLAQFSALLERVCELWEPTLQVERMASDEIIFRTAQAPPGNMTNLLHLQLATYAGIAARNFGYAALAEEKQPREKGCRAHLYLRPGKAPSSGEEFHVEDAQGYAVPDALSPAQFAPAYERELAALRLEYQALQYHHAELTERLERVAGLERKATEELNSATQVKRDFLSNVSHELRTPITIMQGYLGLLDQGMWGTLNTDQREALEVAMRNLTRLQRMITDLLDLSSVSGVQLLVAGEPLVMVDVLRLALQRAADIAAEKHTRLVPSFSGEPCTVVGDRDKLVQLFAHLLDNAVKFSDAGSTVVLAARRVHQRVVVEVIDDGIGMTQEQLAHVFLPFVQGESGLTRHYGGLGAGLSLIHNLVTLHGGDIALRSTPGQGTTVTVSLPLLEEEEKED